MDERNNITGEFLLRCPSCGHEECGTTNISLDQNGTFVNINIDAKDFNPWRQMKALWEIGVAKLLGIQQAPPPLSVELLEDAEGGE